MKFKTFCREIFQTEGVDEHKHQPCGGYLQAAFAAIIRRGQNEKLHLYTSADVPYPLMVSTSVD